MPQTYQMVILNIVMLSLVAAFFCIYRFVYPKKRVPSLVIVLLLSMFPIVNAFRPGAYESGDFKAHVYRTMEFFDILKEGVFRPQWSLNLNATYGYPTFLIGAPLTYYLGSFFHAVGFSFITSIKLVLAGTFVGSGIAMYLWAKKLFGEKFGVVCSIFYLYAPFHLVDINFRASVGDSFLYLFFPLSLLGATMLLKKRSRAWFVFQAMVTALLCLSHPMALVVFGFTVAYAVFYGGISKTLRANFVQFLYSLLFGLALSAFFWYPVIGEGKFMLTSLSPLTVEYAQLSQFLYSPWRFGLLFQGHKGELSYVIGYVQWMIIAVLGYLLLKKRVQKQTRSYTLFFLAMFIAVFVMFFKESQPIWNLFPLLQNVQFSYRLLLLEVMSTAVLAGLLFQHIKRSSLVVFICAIAIATTILNWGHRATLPNLNDARMRQLLPYSTAVEEGGDPAMPRWVGHEHIYMNTIPAVHSEVLSGKAVIQQTVRGSEFHQYLIIATTSATIKENTLYYPGWVITDNGIPVTIQYERKDFPGIMMYTLPKGSHIIEVHFTQTPLRHTAAMISLVSACILLVLVIRIVPLPRKRV